MKEELDELIMRERDIQISTHAL